LSAFTYQFAWDKEKAAANRTKHGVAFEVAATVFRDELALSIYDEDHSAEEERWITIGTAKTGELLLVVHTFEELTLQETMIRIISAREPTRQERLDYQGPVTGVHETMKDQYDFSKGVRGKFGRKDALLRIPIYLEPEVLRFLSERAKAQGIEVGELVNELLKRDIEMIEAAS